MRTRFGVAAWLTLFLSALLSGCSGDTPEAGEQTGAPWFDEVAAARSAGAVAGCALPVRFDLADRWTAKPVRLDGSAFDGLARQGDATLACEIDAKPAGHLGFLRIWTVAGATTGARPGLEAFLAADRGVSEIAYRDLTAGGMSAAEVTYERASTLDADGKRERALAVAAPQGLAVISLSGLTSDEYAAMLPAYRLARGTLAPAS